MPTPVGVLQVTDADAAEEGLATLRDCAGSDVGGWVIEGDWAVIAETEKLAQEVVDADGSLADDETYQKWNGELGDAGVMSFYAVPGRRERSCSTPWARFPMGMAPAWAAWTVPRRRLPEDELPEEMTAGAGGLPGHGGHAALRRRRARVRGGRRGRRRPRWRTWPPTAATTS